VRYHISINLLKQSPPEFNVGRLDNVIKLCRLFVKPFQFCQACVCVCVSVCVCVGGTGVEEGGAINPSLVSALGQPKS